MFYVYDVNGTHIESKEPFGKAWAEAERIAKEEHCAIFRQMVNDVTGEITNQYYTGGCFMPERYIEKHLPTIF